MPWGNSIFSRYNEKLGLKPGTQWSGKMTDMVDYVNAQKNAQGQVTPGTTAATPLNSTTYAPGQAIPQVNPAQPAPMPTGPTTPGAQPTPGTPAGQLAKPMPAPATVAQAIAPAVAQTQPAQNLQLGQFAPTNGAQAPVTGQVQTQPVDQPMPIAANQVPEPATVANMLTPGAPQPYTQAYPGATYPQNTLFSDKRLKKNIKGMKC